MKEVRILNGHLAAIHQPIHGQMQALLLSLEEELGSFPLKRRMRDSFPNSEV